MFVAALADHRAIVKGQSASLVHECATNGYLLSLTSGGPQARQMARPSGRSGSTMSELYSGSNRMLFEAGVLETNSGQSG